MIERQVTDQRLDVGVVLTVLAETLVLLSGGRCSTLTEVAESLDLAPLLAVLLADRTHLSLFVLLIGRDTDVGGDLHGGFGHPIRTGVQYIKNGSFLAALKNFRFQCHLLIQDHGSLVTVGSYRGP